MRNLAWATGPKAMAGSVRSLRVKREVGLLAQVHRHPHRRMRLRHAGLIPSWVEMPLTILSWFLPGSAVVVGVLGQIALAVDADTCGLGRVAAPVAGSSPAPYLNIV